MEEGGWGTLRGILRKGEEVIKEGAEEEAIKEGGRGKGHQGRRQGEEVTKERGRVKRSSRKGAG